MTELNANWRINLDHKTDYGIGSIGCGGIVQYAHMPAYKKAGFRTVAAYDLNPTTAQKVAEEFNIPHTYAAIDELLADPAVEIVDIAVPPWVQVEIVAKVAAAGKPMLCQKPLGDTFASAVKSVELAHHAGVKQAVNQQMRWDAGIAASRDLIQRGLIGHPTDAQIQVSCETPWHMWPWLAATPKLEVMFHSIHYLDSLRSIFGDPVWVTSRHARYPNQGKVQGETKTITTLDYANGLQALVAVNHYNLHGDTFATFKFFGTEGAIEGTIGLMYNYPAGEPDTLIYQQKGKAPVPLQLDTLWIPDAFVGPMASLMQAVETNGTPDTDSADNLNTLRLVHAAYLSAQENRSVQPSEIQALKVV